MTIMLDSLAEDRWVAPRGALAEIKSGLRSPGHYMRSTAIQASPARLAVLTRA